MFDESSFVQFCQDALDEPLAPSIIQAELRRIVARPAEIALPQSSDRKSWRLHRSSRLTVLHTAYAPSLRAIPHSHGAWAVVSVYRGREDSAVFVRNGRTISVSHRISINPGEVVVFEPDAIHDLSTSPDEVTYSIHVYGGDLFDSERRRMWIPPAFNEETFDDAQFGQHNNWPAG